MTEKKCNTNLTEMQDIVKTKRHKALTTSLIVAEKFGRRHTHILDEIEKLIEKENRLFTEPTSRLSKLYFKKSFYKDSTGRKLSMYEMDKEAFVILVMGFRTDEAHIWKRKFYQAFDYMATAEKENKTSLVKMQELVSNYRHQVMTTSLIVAERFKKRHDNVLLTIKNLNCSNEFRFLNFKEATYSKVQGNVTYKYPMYRMTGKGFAFLVTGFTGKEAGVWKERFLDAFDLMATALNRQESLFWKDTRQRNKAGRFNLTDAIAEFVKYAEKSGSKNAGRYYGHITKALNKAAFGSETVNRDLLPEKQLHWLTAFEYDIADVLYDAIDTGTEYHEIFVSVRDRIDKITLILTA